MLALLALPTAPTPAAQVLGVHVARDQTRFRIDMHIVVDAMPPEVFRALQNYAAMPRYNPDLRAVRVEPTSTPNRVRLMATIHACMLLFCKTVYQQQVMTATASANGGTLRADLLPRRGAFNGHGRWTVRPCRGTEPRACVDVQMVLTPEFWVPPVVGTWLVRRKMAEEAQRSSQGLESVARHPVTHPIASPTPR